MQGRLWSLASSISPRLEELAVCLPPLSSRSDLETMGQVN